MYEGVAHKKYDNVHKICVTCSETPSDQEDAFWFFSFWDDFLY